jgi:glycosyltransferase involved in cell wall biosynthesis
VSKITHLLQFCPHGKLSRDHVVSGARGITGSEQALMAFARASALEGHRVVVYIPTTEDFLHEGVWYKDCISRWPRLEDLDDADVVVAWLSADPLLRVSPDALRVMVLQINDWGMCATTDTRFRHVDVFVVQSAPHVESLWSKPFHPVDRDRTVVIPNGIQMSRFSNGPPRIKDRLIACSSPDRGVHWLLYLWPQIKQAVPNATLHIFYEVMKWADMAVRSANEIGQRARYMLDVLPGLESHGVVLRGAVSPEELSQELLRSDLMTYPFDTLQFTEGFSVSTMEACAAGTVPIITDVDALGEIYANSGAIIVPRTHNGTWIEAYRDAVVQTLKSGETPDENLNLLMRRAKCRTFAAQYDYGLVGKQFHDMLESKMASKKEAIYERTVVDFPGTRLAGRNSVSNVRADGGVYPQS